MDSKVFEENEQLKRRIEELEKELKETTNELERNQRLFKTALDLSPNTIYVYKGKEKVYDNIKTDEIANVDDPNKLIKNNVSKGFLLDPKYKEEVNKRINALMEKETTVPYMEQRFTKSDGSEIYAEVAGASFLAGGEMHMVYILRDITEKKLLQEEGAFNIMRTEFFADLSHELKTPLNVIIGSQQLLSLYLNNEELLNANFHKVDKHLKVLKQNCNRLLRLINNLIDITRIDSGFFELNMSNYNLVNAVEEITLSVAEHIESKGINLIFDTDVEEKVTFCDLDKIERIMLNLLSNAIKFTELGGEIAVNLYDKGNSILISVKDTGIGIPKDKLNMIFDRFRQADSSFTRKREGSGIGLSLVKALVEMHEGTITVNSQQGQGTQFIIELPIKDSNETYFTQKENININEEKVERIQIELSDIYSL